jgi:osmoprotectant transport system substrate-binding protein
MRVLFTQILFFLTLIIFCLVTLSGCDRQQISVKKQQSEKVQIKVGCKMHTEQMILMKILSIYLKEQGYDVSEVHYMSTPVARAALESGKIDLYWEYTGTALRLFYHHPAESNPQIAYQTIGSLDRDKGLVWLNMTPSNSTYSILMQRDKAEKLGITSISELAAYMDKEKPGFLFASSSEFYNRVDGLVGLQLKYGFAFQNDNVSKVETKLLYNALREDQFDVISGIATDGRIAHYDLLELKDDLAFFPAYNGAPVIRQQMLEQYPELKGLINRIPALVSNQTLKHLTYQVDVERRDVFEVVRSWLKQKQLL